MRMQVSERFGFDYVLYFGWYSQRPLGRKTGHRGTKTENEVFWFDNLIDSLLVEGGVLTRGVVGGKLPDNRVRHTWHAKMHY